MPCSSFSCAIIVLMSHLARIKKIFSVCALFLMITGGSFSLFIPQKIHAQTVQDVQSQRAELEAQLKALEAEIAQKQADLNAQKGQSASLNGDIKLLTTKIEKAKLDIKAKNITINKLSGEITDKNKHIASLDERIAKNHDSLGQLLRKAREVESNTIVDVILSNQSLSEVYGDLDDYDALKKAIGTTLDEIRGVKTETTAEREELKKRQDAERDAKDALESAKAQVQKSEAEKQSLLVISKDKEKTYAQILADRQAKAAQIRSALFALAGGSAAIPFGDALKYAEFAGKQTGVRPAFLLAILTQETNLGANVGSCYLSDKDTGAGVGINSGTPIANVMKPGRDVEPFIAITKSLGRDPFHTRVSCPFSYGYGGAMGPSQFIASTWMLLKSKISAAIGGGEPDPWAPRDAFTASSVYLANLGATAQTYTAEWNAACKYYSGRSCTTPGVKNAFYGNSVMALAKKIQTTMIDPLQGL